MCVASTAAAAAAVVRQSRLINLSAPPRERAQVHARDQRIATLANSAALGSRNSLPCVYLRSVTRARIINHHAFEMQFPVRCCAKPQPSVARARLFFIIGHANLISDVVSGCSCTSISAQIIEAPACTCALARRARAQWLQLVAAATCVLARAPACFSRTRRK